MLAVLLAAGIVWVCVQWNRHAALEPYAALLAAPQRTEAVMPLAVKSALKVTFLGVTTLLMDDGETAIMTDGFFSRPGLSQLWEISPNLPRIEQALARSKVLKLSAVVALHSHYDHALDAPVVATRTGALLVGSESTANIGRGQGVAEQNIVTMKDKDVLKLGRFTLTFIDSVHSPSGFALGSITEPLMSPAHATDYKVGDCFSLVIEHDGQTILVQASAGFIPGALAMVKADVVYLGVGMLGKQTREYKKRYWQEVVRATLAKRVVLVHWDDFFKPLSEPLVTMPRLIDDFDTSVDFLRAQAEIDKVDLRIPQIWQAVDPTAGLPLEPTKISPRKGTP